MCGIVGAAGDLSYLFRTKVFKDFLDVCQVRGRDSTGVVKVDRNCESYDWVKQIGSPAYLYDGKAYEQRIERGEASVLIGHCRAKTVGEVTIKNAHPFDFPEQGIVGVHNGTLNNHYRLSTHKHGMVDSEVMYQFLAENGAQETFTTIEGAWACVWWDQSNKTLNFIRNDKRPLYFTWSDDARQMFWASEPWMFAAVERHTKLWDGGKQKQKIIALPENTLWSFKIDASAKGDAKVLNMRPARKIVPAPEKKAPVHTAGDPYSGGARTGAHSTVRSRPGWNYNQATGMLQRDPPPSKETEGKGVTNPFLLALREKYPGWDKMSLHEKQAIIRKRQEIRPLNDQIADLFGLTADEPTAGDMSNVAFLNVSARDSDSTKPRSSTTRQKKPLISLPGKTSTTCQHGNNVVLLGEPKSCCDSSSETRTTLRIKSGVSHRVVAGIEYITDNKTSREYTSTEFIHNTGGSCAFCKTPVHDIFEVGEIIDPSSFLCESCIQEPKNVRLTM